MFGAKIRFLTGALAFFAVAAFVAGNALAQPFLTGPEPLVQPQPSEIPDANEPAGVNSDNDKPQTAAEPVFVPEKPAVIASDAHESASMRLEEALRQAYLHNPTLLAAREQLKAVHERLPQAYAGWKPSAAVDLSISSTDLSGSNFGDAGGATSKDANAYFNQPLYRGGRTLSQIKAARFAIRAQREALRRTEQQILLEAGTAFMNVVRDQALLELSLNNRDVLARQLEAANLRFEAGELTRTDVSQSQSRLARAESDLIRARGDLSAARATFEKIIGFRPGHLQKPDLKVAVPGSVEEATDIAESNNPDILSASFAHQSAEEDVDNIFGELLPEVGLSGSWNRTRDPQPGFIDEQTSRSIGITASIPLYEGGGVRSRVRQAKHEANQRYLEILEARRDIRQAAITDWDDLRSAEAEIRSRSAQVEAAAIAREGVDAESILGVRTVLDVLDAEQEWMDANVALTAAERDEGVARLQLLATIGRLSPGLFGIPDQTAELDEHLNDIQWKIFGMDVDSVGEGQ